MKETVVCAVCRKEIPASAAREFGHQKLCQDCFQREIIPCDYCGVLIWKNAAYGDDTHRLCHRCYDHEYTECEDCGCMLSYDDACYYDGSDIPYCQACYVNHQNRSIKSYQYKPVPIFYGTGDLYFGVELEIDCGGEDQENAKELINSVNSEHEHIYCKHDGSIEEGFEIVSHPMTLEYHTTQMEWKTLFELAVDLDYRSHQTSTCGLHIHVNRSAFGKTWEEQEDCISRMVYFVENHWNELLKFSRRTETNINRWASRYGISTTAKDTYEKAKKRNLGRYVAVNLENGSTVEFRLFRGTLCYHTFVASLQLVYEICRYAIQMSDMELEHLSWSEFVARIPEDKKELIEYLKTKRLYVNELPQVREEM